MRTISKLHPSRGQHYCHTLNLIKAKINGWNAPCCSEPRLHKPNVKCTQCKVRPSLRALALFILSSRGNEYKHTYICVQRRAGEQIDQERDAALNAEATHAELMFSCGTWRDRRRRDSARICIDWLLRGQWRKFFHFRRLICISINFARNALSKMEKKQLKVFFYIWSAEQGELLTQFHKAAVTKGS